MKIEAITICVGENALKFLKITLPQNKKFFDRYIVITASNDLDTIKYCEEAHPDIDLLITDSFYKNGAKFDKGAVYNDAFTILKYHDGICIMDCDSYIPNDLGELIKKSNFDIDYMYGCRRVIVPKYYDFNLLCNWGKEIENKYWIPDGICYGYFVLFNYKAKTIREKGFLYYPNSPDSSNADWQFRNFYFGILSDDAKQYFGYLKELPEKVWHLGEPNMSGGHKFFE